MSSSSHAAAPTERTRFVRRGVAFHPDRTRYRVAAKPRGADGNGFEIIQAFALWRGGGGAHYGGGGHCPAPFGPTQGGLCQRPRFRSRPEASKPAGARNRGLGEFGKR